MKKIIMPAIAALAILAVVSMPAYAGPGCGKGDKPACSAIGFKAACGDADKGVCMTKYGMTEEDCKEVCTTLEGNCDFTEISIKGMTCTSCETILTGALEKVPGVAKVVMINYKDGKAVVAVDRKKAKDDFLVKAVADTVTRLRLFRPSPRPWKPGRLSQWGGPQSPVTLLRRLPAPLLAKPARRPPRKKAIASKQFTQIRYRGGVYIPPFFIDFPGAFTAGGKVCFIFH